MGRVLKFFVVLAAAAIAVMPLAARDPSSASMPAVRIRSYSRG